MYCNQCGAKLDDERATRDTDGRAKLYADIAHPINSDCRELIQDRVLAAYEIELVRAREPGYVCTYDDYGEENYATLDMDEELTPTWVSRSGDGTHRIEPAAAAPAGPHHRAGVPAREAAPVRGNGYAADDDEPFGAGII
jgi:stage V sporulation protein G